LRNINLLPRRPYLEKAFIPLMALSIIVSLLIAVLLIFTVYRSDVNVNKKTDQIAEMKQRVQQLNQLRQIDQTTTEYKTFNDELRKVKETRRYWMPVFDLLSTSVQPTARVVTMGAKEQGKMSLDMEFSDLNQIANYVALLQKSSIFNEVSVISIQKVEKKLTTDKKDNKDKSLSSTADPTSILNANPLNPQQPTEKTLTKEEYVQSLEKQTKEPTTKSDELLSELNWIINQQASRQQLNLELPEKNILPPSNNNVLPKSNPFSKEEIDSAQKTLNELKKTKRVVKDQKQSVVEELAKVPDVILYQVSFDLRLKILNPTK
jgi:hypothetical protein